VLAALTMASTSNLVISPLMTLIIFLHLPGARTIRPSLIPLRQQRIRFRQHRFQIVT
jgi:hypothetical protein